MDEVFNLLRKEIEAAKAKFEEVEEACNADIMKGRSAQARVDKARSYHEDLKASYLTLLREYDRGQEVDD